MSKAEILAELVNLLPEERTQVLNRLLELQEADLLNGVGPSEAEKVLLDAAQAEFDRDGNHGIPWNQAMKQIWPESLR